MDESSLQVTVPLKTSATCWFYDVLPINTIYTKMQDFLLPEDVVKEQVVVSALSPEIKIVVEGVEVNALVDTGSNVTCLSESVLVDYSVNFDDCASLQVVGLKATGFTGEKSARIKKQLRAGIELGKIETSLNFSIVPKLVRECILGMDSLELLNVDVNVASYVVEFSMN